MRTANYEVYSQPGRFAGWPANNGIWHFGEEIVVGYTEGELKTSDSMGHKIRFDLPTFTRQSRSLDGGKTWRAELLPEMNSHADCRVFNGELNFYDPELALRCLPDGVHAGAVTSWWYSHDRCRTWNGPYEVPYMGETGMSARSEFLPHAHDRALLFFACPKADGMEGRAAVALMTAEGGFEFLSYIGEPPQIGFTIMPASYLRRDGSIVAVLRAEDGGSGISSLEQYESSDGARSWSHVRTLREFPSSTPPAMAADRFGRLWLTYGFRAEPYGVRGLMSDDEGRHWSGEFVLRDDGGCEDLGYTRLCPLPSGEMLTCYYYNRAVDGGRCIAATVFGGRED